MISKILVPTDGSKTAQKTAMYAIDLAKQLKASVIVLSVTDKRSFIGQTVPAGKTAKHVIEPIEDYLREAAEGYAGEIKKLCDKNGVQSTIVITAGHPIEDIVKEAERAKAVSDYYGFSREECSCSCSPRERRLWRTPQRNKNTGAHCEEVMKGSLLEADSAAKTPEANMKNKTNTSNVGAAVSIGRNT